MAVMTVQEFEVEEDDLSTTNYDAVSERLNIEADPPAGLIVHTAGFTGNGQFRIVNVWESEQSWESFRDGRLAAALQPLRESGEGAPPSVECSYGLHNMIT
ncbi:MAG TPA: hypothetical protein VKC63_01035 [Solirubrobacterales bacterium]|nr:hypothetical protein [Solirubrobacterales bacterium]